MIEYLIYMQKHTQAQPQIFETKFIYFILNYSQILKLRIMDDSNPGMMR